MTTTEFFGATAEPGWYPSKTASGGAPPDFHWSAGCSIKVGSVRRRHQSSTQAIAVPTTAAFTESRRPVSVVRESSVKTISSTDIDVRRACDSECFGWRGNGCASVSRSTKSKSLLREAR